MLASLLRCRARHSFGIFSDFFGNRSAKQAQQEFMSEMEFLANKTEFTLMDFKIRIDAKHSTISKTIMKKVEDKEQIKIKGYYKVLNALFENELITEEAPKRSTLMEICQVTNIPIEIVEECFFRFSEYRLFQKVVRERRVNGQPLPESQAELISIARVSRAAHEHTKAKRQPRSKHSRRMRANISRLMDSTEFFDRC